MSLRLLTVHYQRIGCGATPSVTANAGAPEELSVGQGGCKKLTEKDGIFDNDYQLKTYLLTFSQRQTVQSSSIPNRKVVGSREVRIGGPQRCRRI
jgi:hypothetical protein